MNINGIQLFAPSAFMLFIFSIKIIDFLYPRFRIVRIITGIPSLNGRWEGTIERNVNNKVETRVIILTIHQKWSHIALTLYGENSKSEAKLVKMFFDNPKNVTLKWVYDSRPLRGNVEQYNQLYGEGITELVLRIEPTQSLLQGHYYSSKLHRGTVMLERVRQ